MKLTEALGHDFEARTKLIRLLASRGQKGRKIPDLLVAAAAEDANLTVLHYDTDFDLIARATGQRCEWVMRAGTVD